MGELKKGLKTAPDIGDDIKKRLEAMGIKVAEFEANEDIGRSTYTNAKTFYPRVDKMYAIARYFNVTLDEMVTGQSNGSWILSDEQKSFLGKLSQLTPEKKAFVDRMLDDLIRL